MKCDNCGKEWRGSHGGHDRYCPEHPAKGHKWTECVCFVHTCYVPASAEKEHDDDCLSVQPIHEDGPCNCAEKERGGK